MPTEPCDYLTGHVTSEGGVCALSVSAVCFKVNKDKLILSRYVRSRIYNNLIAGRFGLVCRPLSTAYKMFALNPNPQQRGNEPLRQYQSKWWLLSS